MGRDFPPWPLLSGALSDWHRWQGAILIRLAGGANRERGPASRTSPRSGLQNTYARIALLRPGARAVLRLTGLIHLFLAELSSLGAFLRVAHAWHALLGNAYRLPAALIALRGATAALASTALASTALASTALIAAALASTALIAAALASTALASTALVAAAL